ncbi:hypothetical protein [Chitinophaga pinensis]|uniref:Lipoprotein n=1 Tax=Chitinophaga pinensis (strain ATCC 43595 / DSM 2588 / LMG 13176 / NBRC 15968 / NCIMB 11800 / UQM 2034) TaxID=485918 RepID=A0A979GBQ3_CHIPD|nr:hypothetical protein [Chitinophaga pinensis]ACU64262.1 hypothetical protein Cpin_6861 [Chitinophaga pinensis DSM 2588]
MRKLLALICCALILCACKKDKSELIVSGTYESSNKIELSTVVLYSKNMKITDTAFIKAFIERQNMSLPLFNLTGSTGQLDYGISINYVNDDSVTVRYSGSRNYQATKKGTLVSVNDDIVLFREKDSSAIQNYTGGELGCNNVPLLVRKYAPTSYCYTVPCSSGFCTICKTAQQFTLERVGNDLTLPLISYVFTTAVDRNDCQVAQWNIQDIFNPDVLNTIHTQDTLVVQTGRVRFIKK